MTETVQEWAARIEREDRELAARHGWDKLNFGKRDVPEPFRRAFDGSDSDDDGDSDNSSSANWDAGTY